MIRKFAATVADAVQVARRIAARRAGIFRVAALAPNPLESAAPPAGTSIGNQASATYTDSSNTPRTATSNVAITIVQQVSSFTITTDGQSKQATAGAQVFFPHTISKIGRAHV